MADYNTLFIGPSGSKRTEQCKIPLSRAELEPIILSRQNPVGVITPRAKDEGYELRFLKPKDRDYEFSLFVDLRRKEDGEIEYRFSTPNTLVTPDEAIELQKRAVYVDLLTTRYAYYNRDCAQHDRDYAIAHAIVDLDTQYVDLLEKYNVTSTWYTALVLFLFVGITALVSEDIEIVQAWYDMHQDIAKTFSDSASEAGDKTELDSFVDQIGDILMLVRKRLQIRP